MKKQIKSIVQAFIIFTGIFTYISCENTDDVDKYPITNDFRVLQVNYDGMSVTGPIAKFDPLGQMQLIFSHGVNKTAFEAALSISPATDYSLSYDETNSLIIIGFNSPLAYETDYTLSLPKGTYGSEGQSSTTDYQLLFTTKAFVPPTLSISVERPDIFEGDQLTITASISESTLKDVSFDIVLSGTAQLGADYTISSTSLIIPAGQISATVLISSLVDTGAESPETIIVNVNNLVNCVPSASGALTVNLIDEAPLLEFKGVMELQGYNATGIIRGVHLSVLADIADLSVYGVEIASNGAVPNPADIEFTFPNGSSASAGDQLFIIRDIDLANARTYFGSCFDSFKVYVTTKMTANGDDVFVLYKNQNAIEYFGEPGVDGTGEVWEYTDSWAYKLAGEWIYAGAGAVVNAGATNAISRAAYPFCSPLQLEGVTTLLWSGAGVNDGKTIHVRANRDITDLSKYGLGVANNGGGTDGVEFTFPAVSVSEGDEILVARVPVAIAKYYGNCYNKFDLVVQGDFVSQNGDDAIELFYQGNVIETYGDATYVPGTGLSWEYTGSWAYKTPRAWTKGALNCAATATNNSSSSCPYPFCN
ncbi:MAG: hypothetical protein ACI87N_000846 [Flavobacteriales bacterium]|jgi:hypothetical protein